MFCRFQTGQTPAILFLHHAKIQTVSPAGDGFKQSQTTAFQDLLSMLGCELKHTVWPVYPLSHYSWCWRFCWCPAHLRNVTPEAFVAGNLEDWRHWKPRRCRSTSNGVRHGEQLRALSTVLDCYVIPAHDITDRDSQRKQVVGTSAVSHARCNGYNNNKNNNNSGAMQMLPPTCRSREAALFAPLSSIVVPLVWLWRHEE